MQTLKIGLVTQSFFFQEEIQKIIINFVAQKPPQNS